MVDMVKTLNGTSVEQAMTSLGMNAAGLAASIGVSRAAVSNWLSGKDFPRPAKLLRLAAALRLPFNELAIQARTHPEPVVAFRRMAKKTTTDVEVNRAKAMGELLRPLSEHIPANRDVRPASLIEPTRDYDYLQRVALDLRSQLHLGPTKRIEYVNLIEKIRDQKAIIVPVLWGKKLRHENALHIQLPETGATWIYLNLDSVACDFNFWMAHELAHVFSPSLTGTDEGEDFADAFASALLFPAPAAKELYDRISVLNDGRKMAAIKEEAEQRVISPLTVWSALNAYATRHALLALDQFKISIHGASKNVEKTFPTITQVLFQNSPPGPQEFVEICEKSFNTPMFAMLREYLLQSGEGHGYLKQVLDISDLDARSMFTFLMTRAHP